jgi:hypothetical protein
MTSIKCVAEFEDGSKETFKVPEWDLRSGDHVLPIIAGERQREPMIFPQLKPGKIVRVYRESAD